MAIIEIESCPIGAVVFDLDGTLIHSTVDFSQMKQRLLEELLRRGVPVGLLNPQDTTVTNLDRALKDLSSRGREAEERALRDQVGRLMSLTEMERVSETRQISGANECLRALKQQGIGTGLLTRGSRAYAIAALRYAGIDAEFDAMVCRDDHPEEEAKPNGKAMERIAALLELPPESCLVVGDHLMDMTCARSRSAPFIGVLTGSFDSQDWEEHHCHHVISSVAELPWLLRFDKQ